MNGRKSIVIAISIAVFFSLMVAAPLAEVADTSDRSFNKMLGTMMSRDTGSGWFDYYVEVLNQELANKDRVEPFGAAGPEGPVSGFDGYLENFIAPDTGSRWFNYYVDRINHVIQEKQQQ